jgi:antitoxin HicB
MQTDNQRIGSGLDQLLDEDGALEEVSAIAIKRVIAWQIEEAMKAAGVSKAELAKRMHTSRSQLDRVLDHRSPSLTIETLSRVVSALGYRFQCGLVPAAA